MPKPGNDPLNRFHLVNGPLYRHASLQTRQSKPAHILVELPTFEPKGLLLAILDSSQHW